MYLHVCWHVFIRHTCTYALDTAPMSQDTCRYSQIDADTGIYISHIHCAYVMCIQMYPVHVCVCICALFVLHIHAYISIHINPYVCCMCFTYMHICTGRITDAQAIKESVSHTFFSRDLPLFIEILRTFTRIFLRVLRSEYSFSDGGTFLS